MTDLGRRARDARSYDKLLDEALPQEVAGVEADRVLTRFHWTMSALLTRAHSTRAHEALGARAGVPLQRYLLAVLFCVHGLQPVRVSAVADIVDQDVSRVSRHVAELVSRGYVRRHSSPSDRRVVLLSLTDRGERLAQRILSTRLALLSEVMADWSEDDRVRMVELMGRFDTAFERWIAKAEAELS